MEAHGVNNPDAEMVASKLLGFLIKAFIDKVSRKIANASSTFYKLFSPTDGA